MLTSRGENLSPLDISGKPLCVYRVRCLCVPRLAPSSQPVAYNTAQHLHQAASAAWSEFLGCLNFLALD